MPAALDAFEIASRTGGREARRQAAANITMTSMPHVSKSRASHFPDIPAGDGTKTG